MKRIKMPLLARIIIAILLGVIFGNFFNEAAVRAFLTFNGIFSQFLGFMIPLIIIGLVTPAIADIGHGAGKLLLATVGIAFADTILAGLLAYGTGSALFPHMIANSAHVAVDKAEELKPFFEIKIPAMVDVMSALVFSFIAGLGIAHKGSRTMQNVFQEFKEIVSGVIAKVIIPLLYLRHLPGHDFLGRSLPHSAGLRTDYPRDSRTSYRHLTLRISVGWRLVPQESF